MEGVGKRRRVDRSKIINMGRGMGERLELSGLFLPPRSAQRCFLDMCQFNKKKRTGGYFIGTS